MLSDGLLFLRIMESAKKICRFSGPPIAKTTWSEICAEFAQ